MRTMKTLITFFVLIVLSFQPLFAFEKANDKYVDGCANVILTGESEPYSLDIRRVSPTQVVLTFFNHLSADREKDVVEQVNVKLIMPVSDAIVMEGFNPKGEKISIYVSLKDKQLSYGFTNRNTNQSYSCTGTRVLYSPSYTVSGGGWTQYEDNAKKNIKYIKRWLNGFNRSLILRS